MVITTDQVDRDTADMECVHGYTACRYPWVLRLLAVLFLVVAIVNAVIASCDHVLWPLAITSLSTAVAMTLERHTTKLIGVTTSR